MFAKNNIQFKLEENGHLYVSYDKGCTWTDLGNVTGAAGADGSAGGTGGSGQQGQQGPAGADGLTPYINEDGTWQIGDDDTHVIAAGEIVEIELAQTADIADVGTPSVELDDDGSVDGVHHYTLKFHELKGAKGDSPIVTATERATAAGTVTDVKVDGVTVATIPHGTTYQAGSGINISGTNVISVIPSETPYPPTVKNELIYSLDDENLTTLPLNVDALVSMSESERNATIQRSYEPVFEHAFNYWTRHMFIAADPTYGSTPSTYAALGASHRINWGVFYNGDEYHEGKFLYDKSTFTNSFIQYFLDSSELKECPYFQLFGDFPTTSTSAIDMLPWFLLSDKTYRRYYSKLALGFDPQLLHVTDEDPAVIAMQAIVGDYWYQIEVLANNSSKTVDDTTTTHTVSVRLRKVKYPFTGEAEWYHLVDWEEGLTIIPYNSTYNNTPADTTGLTALATSAIIVETRLSDGLLHIAFSEPYINNGSVLDENQSVLHSREIVINLAAYHLSYTDKDDNNVEKDFINDEMSETYRAFVIEGFSALADKDVHKGIMSYSGSNYSVASSVYPRVMWREVRNIDKNLLLDFTPEEEACWEFRGEKNLLGKYDWNVRQGEHPFAYFTGSRIAFNEWTNKLFYSTGSKVYQIAGRGTEQSVVEEEVTIASEDTREVRTISYEDTEYHSFEVETTASSQEFVILLRKQGYFDGGKTIKVRVQNTGDTYNLAVIVKGTLAPAPANDKYRVSVVNLFNSALTSSGYSLAPSGKTLELTITFWSIGRATVSGAASA